MVLLAVALLACTSTTPAPTATSSPEPSRVLVGGAEQTSLALRARLLASAARDAEVIQRPGRRGTDALAELLLANADPTLAAVIGPRVLTAELLERASPRLGETIPVARLASEALVVAVAQSSPLADIGGLRRRLESEASSVRFAGSEIGGGEHQLAALLLKEAESGVGALVFAAYGTSQDAVRGVVGGQADVLLARYGEVRAHLAAGEVRALAVSSSTRLAGADIPTLREASIDVVYLDWALLVAPPGVSAQNVGALRDFARRAHDSPAWREGLAAAALVDDFSTDAMTTFVGVELSRITVLLMELGLLR
jgi:putative tricarboxylic transport membrane protein